MITRYDYFYDAQVKRYLMQVVRAFSGFQYMTGARGNTGPSLNLVPCTIAKRNRQAAMIQRNASENTLLSVPQITVDLANLQPDRERLQNPGHMETVQVAERAKDPLTGEYTNLSGNRMTVERLMPRPWTMTCNVDIWTSTMDQKHQLVEQIGCMMYPSFDIQNSDNALDWSAITTAYIDDVNWTSISLPVGTTDEIDITTITVRIPMWLSPPALVTHQTLIHQINTNISQGERDENGVILPAGKMLSHVTTPGNHWISVEKNFITLLGDGATTTNQVGQVYEWDKLLAEYKAELLPSETRIILRNTLSDDTSNDIVGTIQPTADPNIVYWQPDMSTLPQSTLVSVNAIINPLYSVPGDDNLPSPATGQRYLLTGDLAGPSNAWGTITAREGSIIQYNGTAWVVSFNASIVHEDTEYVTNSMSGRQLKWDTETQSWVMAIDGTYSVGYWRLGIV